MTQPGGGLEVAVVGPCAVGKSTLVAALRSRGWTVSQPAQEHSGVPDMWRRMRGPDVLISLDASYDALKRHRPAISWSTERLDLQRARLAHARAHADLHLMVDEMSAEEVLRAVVELLASRSS